jgi:hypothetical protein
MEEDMDGVYFRRIHLITKRYGVRYEASIFDGKQALKALFGKNNLGRL